MGFFFKTQIEKLSRLSKKKIAIVLFSLGIFLSACAEKKSTDVLTQHPEGVPGYAIQCGDGSYVVWDGDHNTIVFTGLDAEKRAEEAAKKFSKETGILVHAERNK